MLHFGTIICSLGARYKSYCSTVARTYFVEPMEIQETNYKILLDTFQLVLKNLKSGNKLNSIYTKATKFIESKNPSLVEKFTKSCGFGMGIEFRELGLTINAKNEQIVQSGMVFNISMGFENLENDEVTDPKKKIYSILLSDTVIIKEDGEAESLTEKCTKKYSDVSYFFARWGKRREKNGCKFRTNCD